uniref:NADH-ubiquinone oxidoreductase chain 6 n=1 Tax=Pseudothericles compressifrons TaxID=1564105 RepID=A0A0N7ARY1_9ORTH|nr:NADH dehydrogenase subunit 6 [Pseudothericles compressifrons]AJW76366.1 NADH dehydrogenase subunit 6 [Pseudothericles compressifrons]
MIQSMLYSTSAIMSMSFTMTSHPMSMVMIILIQAMMVCLMTGYLMKSFWMSYILFLIFLGGMMVLFIYITSIASNEMFSMKSKNIIMMSSMLISMIMMLMIMDKQMIINMNNSDMIDLFTMEYKKESNSPLIKLFNKPSFIMSIMMMIYLFIALMWA